RPSPDDLTVRDDQQAVALEAHVAQIEARVADVVEQHTANSETPRLEAVGGHALCVPALYGVFQAVRLPLGATRRKVAPRAAGPSEASFTGIAPYFRESSASRHSVRVSQGAGPSLAETHGLVG